MKFAVILCMTVCLLVSGGLTDSAKCGHSLGLGVHYLKTLGDIKDVPGFDENAFGFIASYQFNLSLNLVSLEADLEYIPDFGGSDKYMLLPQAWAKLGGVIYGAAGIGIGYIDDNWQDNPFYGIRAGVELSLSRVNLDVFGTYNFQSSETLEGITAKDLDAVTFGAIVRFKR
jgi:hypothetical protein